LVSNASKLKMTKLEETQAELIKVLYSQVVDLSMMSKIELGDDVIREIQELNNDIFQINNDSKHNK
jgi:alpha-N-acetylglucosamine transferase